MKDFIQATDSVLQGMAVPGLSLRRGDFAFRHPRLDCKYYSLLFCFCQFLNTNVYIGDWN
jgi:hypothetical protein